MDEHKLHAVGPVAVVGASGFLGRRLVDTLTGLGAPVAAFTRARPFCDDTGHPAPGLRVARTIFHLATSVNIGLAERHADRVAADHELFRRLLDAARGCPRRPVVVLASSGGAVYDPATPAPHRENSPLRPTTAYGRAKVRLEQLLMTRTEAVVPVVLRLSNPYGPGQPLMPGQGVLRHWIEAISAGQPARVFGDPLAVRDYVYVDDVIDACVRLCRWCEPVPAILNIGSGEPTSLAGLLDVVRGCVADREVAIEYAPGRPLDRRDSWLDIRAAAQTLDWRPTTPLAEGVGRMWAASAAGATATGATATGATATGVALTR